MKDSQINEVKAILRQILDALERQALALEIIAVKDGVDHSFNVEKIVRIKGKNKRLNKEGR